MIGYQNFDIEIGPATGGLPVGAALPQPLCVRVTASPGGEAEEPFAFPFSAIELEIFILRLSSHRGRTRRQPTEQQASTKLFGERLFGALFTGSVARVFESSKALAARDGRGLRIRLRLKDVLQLRDVPWEYLFDPVEDDFVAASKYSPIVRYLDVPKTILPWKTSLPLRVLVAVSTPKGVVELDVRGEIERLTASLAVPIGSGSLELELLEHLTLKRLRGRLRDVDSPVHVLHLIGHGHYDEAKDDGFLVFEDEQNLPQDVSADDLARVVADHRSIRLVVLNSCEGARTSIRDPFAGVARTLLRRGLHAVVAMQFEISDAAACLISEELYTCLAVALPLESAMSEVRTALLAVPNHVEWATPVLFLRAENGNLFELPAAAPGLGARASPRVKKKRVRVASPATVPQPSAMPATQPETDVANVTTAVEAPMRLDWLSRIPRIPKSRRFLVFSALVVLVFLLVFLDVRPWTAEESEAGNSAYTTVSPKSGPREQADENPVTSDASLREEPVTPPVDAPTNRSEEATTSVEPNVIQMATSQFSSCDAPAEDIDVPNGVDASREQMLAAQKAVKAFDVATVAYNECLLSVVDQIKKQYEGVVSAAHLQEVDAKRATLHNASVDRDEELARRFNEQVRVFQAR